MKDLLYAGLGLLSIIIAVWQMISYIGQDDKKVEVSHLPLYLALFFGLVGIGLFGVFLAGRVNKTEEIHVTQ